MPGTQYLNPAEMGPSQGLYSQIVLHEASGQAYISGQVAIDRDGDFIGLGDVEAQTTQILANIGAALESLGEDWSSVIKLTTYLVSAEGIPGFAAARRRHFDAVYPGGLYPAHTLSIVTALSAPHHLVELEAVVSHSGAR